MEEHTTTERGRLSLGSIGHLHCRESQMFSLQLPEHREGLHSQEEGRFRRQAGMSQDPRLGKDPLCMPRRGHGSHRAPSHVFWSSKIWFLLQGLKWEPRQMQAAQQGGLTPYCKG